MPAEESGVSGQGEIVHIGGYTAQSGGRGSGIVAARRDPRTGALTPLGTVAVTPSPSFLARHPTQPVLYAVNELTDGEVSAWRVGSDGGWTRSAAGRPAVRSPVTWRCCPTGVTWWRPTTAAAASRSSRSTPQGVPGERTDLVVHEGHGPDPERQDGAHAHMVSPGCRPGAAPRCGPRHRLGLPLRPGRRDRTTGAPCAPDAYGSPAPGPGTWPDTRTDGAATSSVSWTPRSPPTS